MCCTCSSGLQGLWVPVAKLTWSAHRYETLPSTYCVRYKGLGLPETLGIMHANRMGSNCNNTNREKESMHGTVLGSSFEESQKLGLYDNVGVTRPLRGTHWPHHSVRILSWRGMQLKTKYEVEWGLPPDEVNLFTPRSAFPIMNL
ncbi:hypothetical protein VNO77_23319 [Canavalia gladiata]|uniref:Uncharacterized protein n=1 Tax=Canavalia gladiata TaxID=3824 RepID=A0AAN9L7L9_CANGL